MPFRMPSTCPHFLSMGLLSSLPVANAVQPACLVLPSVCAGMHCMVHCYVLTTRLPRWLCLALHHCGSSSSTPCCCPHPGPMHHPPDCPPLPSQLPIGPVNLLHACRPRMSTSRRMMPCPLLLAPSRTSGDTRWLPTCIVVIHFRGWRPLLSAMNSGMQWSLQVVVRAASGRATTVLHLGKPGSRPCPCGARCIVCIACKERGAC